MNNIWAILIDRLFCDFMENKLAFLTPIEKKNYTVLQNHLKELNC